MSVIDVYFVNVSVPNDVIDALSALLNATELTRANRYRFDDDRRRSIVARAATRRLIGRHLDADPQSLVFVEEEHGKPALRDRGIEFNASHSGDLVALAFARETPVGVDVERKRQLHDTLALARRYFSAEEVAIVEKATDAADAFFTIWTAKEAIVKASGKGIGTGDLHGFTVPFRDPQLRPVVDGWSVAAIDAQLDGYYAAVAARDGDRRINSCRIESAALL
jgi:4'-phosphopantetheinyl transferase